MPTRKLIEVALPLEAINKESAREKSIRHGHPSTLHLWWARRPLAACRAVLFASLVDDPSSHLEQFPKEEDQQRERDRLFRIIEELVKWENSNNERVLSQARAEIRKSTGSNPPPVYDPFAGGGSIPLEAQRLGLEAHASDLNPVAVLINKALIEIPPKFANMPPVNPEDRNRIGAEWKGASGLAADVRYYGKWMRDEAERRIGNLYPKVKLSKEYGGGEATVIAWLWARTVKCPNPACGAQMPLVRSFALSAKKGKEAWVEPVIDRAAKLVRFEVRIGADKPPEGTAGRKGARCLVCETSVPLDYVRAEGQAGRMSAQMMAIVVEGRSGRIFLPPNEEHERIAMSSRPQWAPETNLPKQALGFRVQNYGLTRHRDLFTDRQLTVLTTLSELVNEACKLVQSDSECIGFGDARSYKDAVAIYLAFAVDKSAEGSTKICTWSPLPSKLHVVSTFGRQALPMAWDYAESNIFADSAGNFSRMVELVSSVIYQQCALSGSKSSVFQKDVMEPLANRLMFITDPPYYDNIGYADLSDFFYIWLRRTLKNVYPKLFDTLLVPKAQELVAEPFRHGGQEQARHFFEEGLTRAFTRMHAAQHLDYPLIIYYAFKQAEGDEGDDYSSASISYGLEDTSLNGAWEVGALRASTGWETMLEGLILAGFAINGTWPMRTERAGGFRNKDRNTLASSIVLVCRPRPEDAKNTTRLEFIRALRRELPEALRHLQRGNIAPVDLAQAAIGPGMAVFSRYKAVLEADGTPMRVRTALQLINQALDEVLAEQEGEYDADTRWAIAWFEQYGADEGPYGTAETLSKAKNTSVRGMEDAGVVVAKAGKVRLLKRDELPDNWNPADDWRLTAWEITQHLVHALDKQGEQGAADLLVRIPADRAEIARDLAYRLYTTCERKKWAQEALAYNSLVVAWPEVARLASEAAKAEPVQGRMFE